MTEVHIADVNQPKLAFNQGLGMIGARIAKGVDITQTIKKYNNRIAHLFCFCLRLRQLGLFLFCQS